MNAQLESRPQNDTETRRSEQPNRRTMLALNDLRLTTQPLLHRRAEQLHTRRVRETLRRLSRLLPQHPIGYRRFLTQMKNSGVGSRMVAWYGLGAGMAEDAKRAAAHFNRASRDVTTDPDKATRGYRRGVKILRGYPLDPETLYVWSRETSREQETGPLATLPHYEKIHRVLGKLVSILERERDTLLLPNFRLVLKQVFDFNPLGMLRSDLFQEGVVGLQKAIFRFDPDRGTRLSTYATYWIRQMMRKAITDKDRLIRVPQAVQERWRGRDESLPEAEARRIQHLMSGALCFSSLGPTDDDDSSFDVRDPTTSNALPGEEAAQQMPKVLTDVLTRLSDRERIVVEGRFGLHGRPPKTLREIGDGLKLSRERVRQIELRALSQLRRQGALRELYEELAARERSGTLRTN